MDVNEAPFRRSSVVRGRRVDGFRPWTDVVGLLRASNWSFLLFALSLYANPMEITQRNRSRGCAASNRVPSFVSYLRSFGFTPRGLRVEVRIYIYEYEYCSRLDYICALMIS